MHDILETRRRNLRALVEQWGGVTTLAKKLHYSQPSYLSQMLHGKRPVSERVARKIEADLKLVHGWFDNDRLEQVEPHTIDAAKLGKIAQIVENLPGVVRLSLRQRYEVITLAYEATPEGGTVDTAHVMKLVRLALPD